jgi:T5SS/PEP-CTERM-associated repeat protein
MLFVLNNSYSYVGHISATQNRLIVEHMGKASLCRLHVGYYCNSNSLVIDGAGSSMTNVDTVFVGVGGGCFNSATVRNGGYWDIIRATIGSKNDGVSHSNLVTVCDPGSVWNNPYDMTIGDPGCMGNGLIISNGGVVKIGTTLTMNNSYITNYVSGRSGGLDLASGSTITVNTGAIHIAFTSKPATNGFYWGLRWAGNHTNELTALYASTQLTWSVDALYHNEVSVTYDTATTNTYVGVWYYVPGTIVTLR